MSAGKSLKRYYRTVILGIMAMAALVWVAMDQFDIPREDMAELLLITVLVAVAIILCAAATVLLWVGLRKLRARQRQN